MATHDYVIDDQSAPSFRADLNNALMAIVSQNSNATAPTTTFANMIWYDTATNQLKKRNEANSAWVTLGTIDEGAGTFTPTGGTVAIASQAEAEAGTDNTKMMTPLRVDQAIAANPPTSAQVGTATAGLTAGAVGTYMFAKSTGVSDVSFNGTLAGSSLVPTSALTGFDSGFSSVGNSFVIGSAQSGTWKAMGFYDYVFGTNRAFGATLWLRIA